MSTSILEIDSTNPILVCLCNQLACVSDTVSLSIFCFVSGWTEGRAPQPVFQNIKKQLKFEFSFVKDTKLLWLKDANYNICSILNGNIIV